MFRQLTRFAARRPFVTAVLLMSAAVAAWLTTNNYTDGPDTSQEDHVGVIEPARACPLAQSRFVIASGSRVCLPTRAAARLEGLEDGMDRTLRMLRLGELPCPAVERSGSHGDR